MLHPWIMKQIAEQRQNDLLKEAEACRIACQVKRGQSVHTSSPPRIVTGLGRLLISKVKRLVNRGTVSPAETPTDASREITAG